MLTLLALACALVGEPELLVLDEPTVGLDPLTREDIWSHLRSLADAGTTLLVVRHGRHPLNEIAETAKRLFNGGVSLKGVLLTDVPQEGAFLGSGYQGGYYGYDSIAG